MESNDIAHRFAFHPAKTLSRQEDHADVRAAALNCAAQFNELCPEGREKSLAITKLEEAMMWANAAIARKSS